MEKKYTTISNEILFISYKEILMFNFDKKDLVEKFNAKNNKTGEIIEIFHYQKKNKEIEAYDTYVCGEGIDLSPHDPLFFDQKTGATFTRC